MPTFFDALSLADILEDALLIFQPPSTLLYANPAAMAFAGRLAFSRATPHGDFIGAGRLLALLPPGATELALEGGSWNSQLQAGCVDGNKIQMRASLRNLKRPGQGADVLVALFGCISGGAEAVTDSAEAFERQSASIERTIQSEKMASIGQLAAGVAHEINNPIGYVLSNFGTLQEYQRGLFALIELQDRELQAAGDAAALARVAEMRRRLDIDFTCRDLPHLLSESKEGIRRVQKIVGDLKELARPSRQERWIECDLHKGLDTAINILWSDLKYKVKLQLDYGDIPLVQCQPTELNQAFLNILLNAGQAIRDRGEIGIRTSLHEHEVWVDIADTGEGITDSNRARIFEPFFGTKAGQGCTGLGLSIAYGIVRKHQGRIEVDSRPGGGSRFRVVLPVSQSGAGQAAAEIEPDSP